MLEKIKRETAEIELAELKGEVHRAEDVGIADEIDGFPASAGTKGDPLELADKRTITFPNRKKIKVSIPH